MCEDSGGRGRLAEWKVPKDLLNYPLMALLCLHNVEPNGSLAGECEDMDEDREKNSFGLRPSSSVGMCSKSAFILCSCRTFLFVLQEGQTENSTISMTHGLLNSSGLYN